MNLETAQLFFRNFFADSALHHRWSRDEKLAASANHQRKMRRDNAHRAEPRHRP